MPGKQRSYDPVRSNLFRNFTSHTNFSKNYFFPYCISEWNNLSPNIRNSNSIAIFKKSLLTFIRPKQCNVYNIIDPTGLKLLTRLRVHLSHLSLEIESTSHYLLRCPFYSHIRRALLNNIIDLIGDISNFSDDKLTNLLLYGDNIHNVDINTSIPSGVSISVVKSLLVVNTCLRKLKKKIL